MRVLDLGRVVGMSAYELAVSKGYEGTLESWLESLRYDHSDEYKQFTETIEAARQEILSGKEEINSGKEEIKLSMTQIRDLVEKSLTGIGNAQKTATEAVKAEGTEAASNINSAESGALSNISNAETNALASLASTLDSVIRFMNEKGVRWEKQIEDTGALTKSEYNQNAIAKQKAFDDNSQKKQSAFDTHVVETQTTLDQHIKEKQDAFDSNATEKQTAFDQNADQKIQEYNTHTEQIQADIGQLKEDLSNKITKFYASNQGETHITDSDSGKIQDMMIYGKSSQDGTPTPENPVEIKSVVNPTVKVCGKNLFDSKKFPIILNKAISNETGVVYESTTREYCATEKYIPFPYGGKIISYSASMTLYAYDKDYKFISSVECNGQAPFGTIYVRFNIKTKDKDKAQIELSENTTTYEPYKEQTIQLPITLNAIPVTQGGNVTINGQQYVADYVDVKREKLVKKLKSFTISDVEAISTWGVNENADNITGFYFYTSTNGLPKTNNDVITSTILRYNESAWGGKKVGCAMSSDDYNNYAILSVPTNMLEDISSDENACASLVKICENTNAIFFYSMAYPIETDLTPEEIEAFKALITNHPVTNISVTSDQLDGYTVFNYPISMANGWNYVKKQLNDNRDYIYDMDIQSAEAYVNSEYAVVLTELEV